MSDDSTIVITDITKALSSTEKEAGDKPAALLIVGGPLNGTLFDLVQAEVTVGRNPKNSISLEFEGISRHHFKIIQSASSFFVEDMGSKNGTYLNNRKLDGPAELNKGDIIKMGSIALKYIPKGDPERLSYDKLQEDARTDALTHCFNKGYFNRAAETEVKKCKVTGLPLSLIIFDLDHFKGLNDNHGHDAGDYVLKELAQIIQKNGVREKDIFARYGGEEFVILLPGTNLKDGFAIAERLRKLIENHSFVYDQKKLPVTASIGIADYRKGVLNGTELFKRADQAVYKSKENGRNQVNFFKE